MIPWHTISSLTDEAAGDVLLPIAKQPETERPLLQALEPPAANDDSDDVTHLMDFLVSGWHMLIRSILLQVISRLSPAPSTLRCDSHAASAPDGDEARWLGLCCHLVNVSHGLLCAQATFFMAATTAARLGTAALAAHAVVSQLWMLASFIVDGFAVAGTVLGSRLAAVLETSRSAAQVRRKPFAP